MTRLELPLVAAPVQRGEAELCLGAPGSLSRGHGPGMLGPPIEWLAFELRRRCALTLTDLGPMRAIRRTALLELELRDRGFGWPLEMVLSAARRDWRVAEVPVSYRARAGGRSKVSGSVRGTIRAVRDMSALLT